MDRQGVDFIKVGRKAQIIEIALSKLGARRKAGRTPVKSFSKVGRRARIGRKKFMKSTQGRAGAGNVKGFSTKRGSNSAYCEERKLPCESHFRCTYRGDPDKLRQELDSKNETSFKTCLKLQPEQSRSSIPKTKNN